MKSEDWTKEETDHLFDLCQRFDRRFIIMHDRFDRQKFKERDVEDLKERFYSVSNILKKVRIVSIFISVLHLFGQLDYPIISCL